MRDKIKPAEISDIIRREIAGFGRVIEASDMGEVIQNGDGIARVYGLEGARSGELLEFSGGVLGIALNLEDDNIGAVLLGDGSGIKEGDPVKRTGSISQINASYGLLGRVIDPLGRPQDG
ncbi:MAG: hypothetical protein FWG74_09820 [Planctomycetes bacterium]|nr:hypothetical protein [Planctomycetota bacterium]